VALICGFHADVSGRPEYRDVESVLCRLRALIAASSIELWGGDLSGNGDDRAGEDRSGPQSRYARAMAYINTAQQLSAACGGAFASLIQAAKASALLFSAVRAEEGRVGSDDRRGEERRALMKDLSSLLLSIDGAFGKDGVRFASLMGQGVDPRRLRFLPSLLLKASSLLSSPLLSSTELSSAAALYASAIRDTGGQVHYTVRIGLGICLFLLGHKEAARVAFLRACQLSPSSSLALSSLALTDAQLLGEGILPPEGSGVGTSSSSSKLDPVTRNKAFARIVDSLRKASALAPGHSLTLLNLSHAAFSHWTPLTQGATGQPVTAHAVKGSRRLVISEDVTGRLRPGELIKLATSIVKEGVATTVLVPMRLTAVEHATLVPRAAVETLLKHLPSSIPNAANGMVCVIRARLPWGWPTTTAGIPVLTVDVERAKKFAKSAWEAARTDSLRAEALYALGRSMQASGQFVDAGIQYRNCLNIKKDYIPALFGLGQVCIFAKRTEEGIGYLTQVLSLKPDDRSACRTLSTLYLQQGRVEEAITMARKAHDAAPWDVAAGALYAQLLARQDTSGALDRAFKVTESTIKKLSLMGMAAPPALFNNCGVIAMRQAAHETKPEGRRKALQSAVEFLNQARHRVTMEVFPGVAESSLTNEERHAAAFSPAGVTITFNVARLDEVKGNFADAEAVYELIVGTLPTYFDGKACVVSFSAPFTPCCMLTVDCLQLTFDWVSLPSNVVPSVRPWST
jgi:tetratricopeptide (TPR) repeat protein